MRLIPILLTGLFLTAGSAAFADERRLPPPTTPPELRKPTPPPAEAKTEVEQLRAQTPEAFYNEERPEQYKSLVDILAKDQYEKEQGYRFDKIIRGDHHRKRIALTFDDGPHQKYTIQLLDILKQTHTPATFFVVGKQVEKFPTLVALEMIEGHEVGDHTYDHVNLTKIPPHLIEYELDQCNQAIQNATGDRVRLFRPPGGDYNNDVVRVAAERNYITVLWTDDPGDYANPGAEVIYQRTVSRLEDGALLLLHDGIEETISVLPSIIAEARRQGYEFVTVSQLALEK